MEKIVPFQGTQPVTDPEKEGRFVLGLGQPVQILRRHPKVE